MSEYVTVTCVTEDCENAGHHIEVEVPVQEDGEAITGWQVVCGPCGALLHRPLAH